MDKKDYENIIYVLVNRLFDDNIHDYSSIDNEKFIKYICNETGMSIENYKNIMNIK